MTAPPDGWHRLPDGREGLYGGGIVRAAVGRHPGNPALWATEAVDPRGARHLRNLATRRAAIDHCERVAALDPSVPSDEAAAEDVAAIEAALARLYPD